MEKKYGNGCVYNLIKVYNKECVRKRENDLSKTQGEVKLSCLQLEDEIEKLKKERNSFITDTINNFKKPLGDMVWVERLPECEFKNVIHNCESVETLDVINNMYKKLLLSHYRLGEVRNILEYCNYKTSRNSLPPGLDVEKLKKEGIKYTST